MIYFLKCVGMASMHRRPVGAGGSRGADGSHRRKEPSGPSPTRPNPSPHLRGDDDDKRRRHGDAWIRNVLRPDSIPTLNHPLDREFVRVTFKKARAPELAASD